jgi:hypothetical protein
MAKEVEPDPQGCLGRDGSRGYANALEVDFTLAEFTLDFLQSFGGDEPAPRQCRLVTSPMRMTAFRDTITGAVADYERRYGALPSTDPGEG